jgi:transposase
MPAPKSDKTSMESFIKAIMQAGTLREAAEMLGVSRQAVSKRLQAYKERGVKGLPDFDARSVDVVDVQKTVDKYRRK